MSQPEVIAIAIVFFLSGQIVGMITIAIIDKLKRR